MTRCAYGSLVHLGQLFYKQPSFFIANGKNHLVCVVGGVFVLSRPYQSTKGIKDIYTNELYFSSSLNVTGL